MSAGRIARAVLREVRRATEAVGVGVTFAGLLALADPGVYLSPGSAPGQWHGFVLAGGVLLLGLVAAAFLLALSYVLRLTTVLGAAAERVLDRRGQRRAEVAR